MESAGSARLRCRWLRLHDVYRQQRPDPANVAERVKRRRSGRGGGAERQSQLRGTHQSAGARQLSGLAADGRCLRAGRNHRYRSGQRSARHDHSGQPVYLKDIWPTQARNRRKDAATPSRPKRSCGCTATSSASNPQWNQIPLSGDRDLYDWNARLDVHSESAVLR